MNTAVLDTSVAIAWYLEESFSPSARTWQERLLAGKTRLLVPELHYLEFANVLRTLTVRGTLTARLAADIYALHLDAPLGTAEVDRSVLLSTALEYGATVYDATYISLAVAMEVPLVTAERSTSAWVAKLGARIASVR